MIGVKLTIVLFVITVVSIIVITAVVRALDFKTKFLISLGEGPKWLENVLTFIGFLELLDIIGVIYSVIWLLFFR